VRPVNQRPPAFGYGLQHVAKKRGGAHVSPESLNQPRT
jgi:hypothetical protein